jgi:hypothetical protein
MANAKKQFETILVFLVPQVVKLITEHYKCDEVSAARMFYQSKIYTYLEKEETKVWHFSAHNLFFLFDEEQKTGSFVFPEEC